MTESRTTGHLPVRPHLRPIPSDLRATECWVFSNRPELTGFDLAPVEEALRLPIEGEA